MEEAHHTRLKTLQLHLDLLLSEAEGVLDRIETQGVTLNEVVQLNCRVKQTTKRYSSSLDSYIERVPTPSTEVITSATNKQIEADDILSKLECIIQVQTKGPTQSTSTHHSKLPTLPPPKFSGDILQFQEFWDKFQSTIDRRDLEDVDKLAYLVAALEGKARTSLEGLSISNSNYKIAVDTLKRQFGCKNAQIDAHYEALKVLPIARHPDQYRQTLNTIEHHLRILQTLGENIDGNHLRGVITSKFPHSILHELNMALSEEESTVPQIRKTLERIVTSFDRAKPLGTPMQTDGEVIPVASSTQALLQPETKGRQINKNTPKRKFEQNFSRKRKTDNKERVIASKRKKRSCIFCNADHYSSECPECKDVEQRKKKLVGRCYKCLREGHSIKACRSGKKCYHCKGEHHQSLCHKRVPDSNSDDPKRN